MSNGRELSNFGRAIVNECVVEFNSEVVYEIISEHVYIYIYGFNYLTCGCVCMSVSLNASTSASMIESTNAPVSLSTCIYNNV